MSSRGLSKPNMNEFWSVVLEKVFKRIGQKLHKITHNFMENISRTKFLSGNEK